MTKAKGPLTSQAVMAMWSRAHRNSPIRQKYPTKEALRRAGIKTIVRSERANT